jgi:hypothetical protein
MTREDIIRMAREAGIDYSFGLELERFAELVAAAECEAIAKYLETKPMADRLGIIKAIRARGKE